MPTLYQITVIALLVAFIVLVSDKTGLREVVMNFFDTIEVPLLAKMLQCDLCTCFWLATFICILIAAYTCDVSWIYIPPLATPIARYLL